MAALNRLSQRIMENFQESTRDLNLLTGNSSTTNSAYFDTSEDKVKEISKLLDSRQDRDRLEGMKRIIGGMSKGRDMEGFFAQVVKNVVAPSIEIRKLVYIYLLRFASTNSDLLLLSINTFQKDLSDPSPLIRSMSLRVLTSIRVPVIQGIVMLGLKKLVTDRNPWVRKTVAGGLAKVYEMDSSSLPQLLPLLQALLASQSPLTLGATLTAFTEICPDRLDLLHPYYRHICRLIVDADEWGQIVALDVLTRYARVMLEKPDTSGDTRPAIAIVSGEAAKIKGKGKSSDDEEDEFEGLDTDLAMFLHLSKPLFQSRNPAVVLGMAKAFYHLAPAEGIVGQGLLVPHLLRLAGTSANAGQNEIASLTWEVIGSIVDERPWLFAQHHTRFFLLASDDITVKIAKIKAMASLVLPESASVFMKEFKHYVRSTEDMIAEEAVRAIGHCVRTQPEVALTGLKTLMKLLNSQRAQAVIVLKSVILSTATSTTIPAPQILVARLAKQLNAITNSKARASVFWLVGQYAATDQPPKHGLGWEGVAAWVPDVLRIGVKGFQAESTIAKLQILTLGAKLSALCPPNPTLRLLSNHLFHLSLKDPNYDVRDRSRFLHTLLRGIRESEPLASEAGEEAEYDEKDLGGVVLRREQIKLVLLGQRSIREEATASVSGAGTGSEGKFDVGSMSRVVGRRMTGYGGLPPWTDDPTDSSLRDSEIDAPRASAPAHSAVAAVVSSSAIPTRTGSPAGSGGSPGSSSWTNTASAPGTSAGVGGSKVAKFQDLDSFLNSDTEEETEDETDSEDEPRPAMALQPPPRSAIVPEYDEDTSEEEEEEESEEESEEEAAGGEARPLYASYR